MADTGWVTASTAVDDSSVGTQTWSNPSNASADDGNWGTGSGISLFPTANSATGTFTTHYLRVTPGDLSGIPSTAVILGIEVRYERAEIAANRNVTESSVRLYKDGTGYVGDNKADATEWQVSSGGTGDEEVETKGGASDLWGTTWTRNEVVSDLRVGISATGANFAGAPASGGVDVVEFRITYAEEQTITGELLTATGVIPSSTIDRSLDVTGVLLTASGLIPSDTITLGNSITGVLLTASGSNVGTISYDQVITGTLVTATGEQVGTISYDQNITAPLFTATGDIAGSITWDRLITGVLIESTGLVAGTFTFTQNITAPLITATGTIAGSFSADWFIVQPNTNSDFSAASNNTDTDFTEV